MKNRLNIPKSIKESVLNEYNHKCGICGGEKPQLHHIDENPENNEILNLIPLCPNCHMIDIHNPTRKIPTKLLKLFREYKDPLILDSKFIPVYERMEFLFDDESQFSVSVKEKIKEFLNFISTFNKGEYYEKKIDKLLKYPAGIAFGTMGGGITYSSCESDLKSFIQNVRSNRREAFKLIVELLRYQGWN